MTQINKIERSEVGKELFRQFVDDYVERSYYEHRRNSNFFTCWIVEINGENFPDYPQYHGFWETNTFISDSEYGVEWDEITDLTRVEKREVVTTTTEWIAVE